MMFAARRTILYCLLVNILCGQTVASVDDERASVPARTIPKNLRTGGGGRNRGSAQSSTLAQQLKERFSQGSDAGIDGQASIKPPKTTRIRGSNQQSEEEVTKQSSHSSRKMSMNTKTVQTQHLTKQARILQLANLLKVQKDKDSEDERLGFGFFGNNDNDKDVEEIDDECGRSNSRLGFFGGGDSNSGKDSGKSKKLKRKGDTGDAKGKRKGEKGKKNSRSGESGKSGKNGRSGKNGKNGKRNKRGKVSASRKRECGKNRNGVKTRVGVYVVDMDETVDKYISSKSREEGDSHLHWPHHKPQKP